MLRRLLQGLAACLCLSATDLRAQASAATSFDSDGVRIRYVVQGQADGEPVLLIHGFTANLEVQWAPVLPALAKDYKVIAMDCRGHGRSGKPHDPKQYGRAMAQDAVRLLDHLKIEKAHVVGYSMGARITLQIAARYPERVRTATLGGAGIPTPWSEKALGELAESLEQGKGIGPLLVALTPKDQPRPTELQILAINAAMQATNDVKALAAVIRGNIAPDAALSEEQIRGIQVPMLALIGETDPLREGVNELKKRLPTVKVVVIAKADHMTAFLRKEFVNGLKEFLDAHGAAK